MSVQKIPQTWRDLPKGDLDYAVDVMKHSFIKYQSFTTGRSASEEELTSIMVREKGWSPQYAKLAYDGALYWWMDAICG